jgi:hypothetical protein
LRKVNNMKVTYTLTGSESGGTQILVVIDGSSHTVTEGHPFFHEIRDSLLARDFEDLPRLVDARSTIIGALSSRVTIVGDLLHYNGKPLYSRLTDTIVSFVRAGRNFRPLVAFLERLMHNESDNSRLQLYEFLEIHDFSITTDGHFLAYKGVNTDFTARTRGPGIVNGVEFGPNTNLDNSPGNVLEMIRQEVVDDPTVACDRGLHAGTWSYARSFGPQVVEVKIDPADVVSVPNDCNHQKIRVCRYVVTRAVEAEVNHESRYSVVSDFIAWLDAARQAYTHKARMAGSYEILANRFLESLVSPLLADEVDALRSFSAEMDAGHSSKAVYRYHVDALVDAYNETEMREDPEYEDEEDDYEDEDDEDLW